MKIFISWSGDESKDIASAFRRAVPRVLQYAQPFVSTQDIDHGSRWPEELGRNLELANAGIFCLTKSNLEKPWLLFEAGAISKNHESVVIPFLNTMRKAEIAPPLSLFHIAERNVDDIRGMFRALNKNADIQHRLPDDRLDDAFNLVWPTLEHDLLAAEQESESAQGDATGVHRSERDLLEEVLETTRTLLRRSHDDDSSALGRARLGETRLGFPLQETPLAGGALTRIPNLDTLYNWSLDQNTRILPMHRLAISNWASGKLVQQHSGGPNIRDISVLTRNNESALGEIGWVENGTTLTASLDDLFIEATTEKGF